MTAEKRQTRVAGGRSEYLYNYEGNAVRQPQQWEDAPSKRGRTSRRRRTGKHQELEVREPGKIAPFAVGGMLFACVMVLLMLSQYAKLVEVNDAAVDLRKQIETLKTEEAKLMAQYELAYDLQEIEKQMLSSGEMIKPQGEQTYTISMTRPDSAQYYDNGSLGSSFINGVREIFSVIGTYF